VTDFDDDDSGKGADTGHAVFTHGYREMAERRL
jgi:hypothetical protein